MSKLPRIHFKPSARSSIIEAVLRPNPDERDGIYRKTARILAVQMGQAFEVETEHGVMAGEAGDYLVTNHPDDDPGADIWPVSAARMAATYEKVTR